jgi:hypothetical protein
MERPVLAALDGRFSERITFPPTSAEASGMAMMEHRIEVVGGRVESNPSPASVSKYSVETS